MDIQSPDLQQHGTATSQQEEDMLLASAIGETSNSNTISIVKNGMLLGNGVGQQDRVGAATLALARASRAKHDVTGASAYSDSFFPFPDGPQTLIDAGITSILTTSGSKNDQATIDLCKEQNVALYMIPDSLGRGFFGH
jgi:phosphoribosylaminoimidazolecarboxamide formyltransferase/IMP cyclohydrolase